MGNRREKKPRHEKVPRHRFRKNYKDIIEQIRTHYLNNPLDDEGEWINLNDQAYLALDAPDYYSLGLLEGKWLKSKIKNLRRIIRGVANWYRPKGYSYHRFLEMARSYEEAIPDKYLMDVEGGTLIDEIQGMADSIKGVTFEDIFLQNCFIDLVYGHLFPKFKKYPAEYEFGCTSLGAKLPHSKESIIAGQNFDFNVTFKPTLSFVFHKVADRPQIFSLRMGGTLSLPAGMNDYRVAAFINIVKSSVKGTYTIPSGFRTRTAFSFSKTAEQYFNFIHDAPAPAGYNLLISDPQNLIAVEATAKDFVRRDILQWWVSSNTYNSPNFQKYLLEPEYSKHRQNFAENRMEQLYREGMDARDLMKVLADSPIISRNKRNPFESKTLAFISRTHFGLGNPTDDYQAALPARLTSERYDELDLP